MKLLELAERLDAEIDGEPNIEIRSMNTLMDAAEDQASFLSNPKYRPLLESTRAGAVIIGKNDRPPKTSNLRPSLLITDNPYLSYAQATTILHPPKHPAKGVEQGAFIHPTAKIGKNVAVMAGAYVGEDACVGDGTVLYPGVFIGRNAGVGRDCVLYPNSVVREECILGDRVIVQPNAVIGSDGFGYARNGAKHVKIPQIGNVVVEDDVEIGAGTTVDRAALGETRIGRGTKIDNMVQIGHNVKVGNNCILVAQVGISGSTKLGDSVILAGQAGVAGHLEVGDGAAVGAKAGVLSDLPPGAQVLGAPAYDRGEFFRAQAVIRKLPELNKKLRSLEKKIKALESIGVSIEANSMEDNRK